MSTPTRADALTDRLRAAGCVFAEEEAALLRAAARSPEDLDALVTRRVAGEPLEVLVGWADFAGVRVGVTPGVFVPRQRTALLAELAVDGLADGDVVVDLCCGTGAIGLAIATRAPGIVLHAADIEPAAVACARTNLAPVGGHVHEGDLDDPLPDELVGTVAVLVANVPYVPTGSIALMPPESRDHEPRVTVDGGADGLDVVRRLARIARRWLQPGGRLLVETSVEQADAVVALFAAAGLSARAHHDEERSATAVVGRLPGWSPSAMMAP